MTNVVQLKLKTSKIVISSLPDTPKNKVSFVGNQYECLNRYTLQESVQFNKVKPLTYFLYCTTIHHTKNDSGLYQKIGGTSAIMIRDSLDTYGEYEFFDSEEEYYYNLTEPGEICIFPARTKIKTLVTELHIL